jgi:hypothetical protein
MFGGQMIPLQEQESGVQQRMSNCESTNSVSVCILSLDLHLRAVQIHGNNWVAVADLVQRTAADCSDRFRQHIQYHDTRRRGM